ncbi:MAG: restriction endonuclease subunit S [Bacteroidales bacterium]|nr:restriction endonuclease subunit S [Parabacteroides sp.]MDY5621810.1 restriction endonuclease subunit S [Bacteroidales bacterium]
MEVKKYKLGELLSKIENGAVIKQNKGATGIPITRIETLSNGLFNRGKLGYADIEDPTLYANYVLEDNDLLMSHINSKEFVGRTVIYKKQENECIIHGMNLLRIKTNAKLLDPEFAYYYFQTDTIKRSLYNLRKDAIGQSSIAISDIKNMVVSVPNISIQKEIAFVLRCYDRRIELNRAINQNLEAIAKQLYDYWFVQFDFPGENGKPYKSSGGKMVWNEKLKREIPENWHSDNICLIADILSGGTPSKQINEYWNCGRIPFFGPTDYNGSMFQLQTADKITESGLQHCSSSLFEENTIIITARGSIGKLVIVGTPMAMNQSCYALKSKNEEYEYLYFLTIQLIESLKAKGSGSVFKSIIASDIENTMLCVANKGIISLFCDKVSPIMKQIKKNTQEMIHLTKQRDELLPLLMNGQVSVNSDLSDD